MELLKNISKRIDPDLIKALFLTLGVCVVFMGLYGALVIFTFIWTLPIQLGWQPQILGVTHLTDLSNLWSIEKAPLDILSVFCTFVCLSKGRIFFSNATDKGSK